MNKKLLTVLLVVVLLVTAVISGTMAYFTDSDSAVNVMTLGNVDIEIDEEFDQNSPLYPVVPEDGKDPSDWENYVDKVVDVVNKGDSDAYVRVQLAVPASLDDNGAIHLDVNDAYWTQDTVVTQMVKDGITYNLYTYVYDNDAAAGNEDALPGKATTVEPVLEGVYLDPAVDYDPATGYYIVVNGAKVMLEGMDDANKVEVLVFAQGVQAEGFANAAEAFAAAEFPVPGTPVADVVKTEVSGIVWNKQLSPYQVDGTILDTAYVFKTTESYEEAQKNAYAKWHADFVVTFDRDVTAADLIGLAGNYGSYDWIGAYGDEAGMDVLEDLDIAVDGTIAKGTPIRLLKDIMGLNMNYEELCLLVQEFTCGAWSDSATSKGLTMNVELRLYEVEQPSESNGNSWNVEVSPENFISAGTYSYTF